MDWSRGRSVGVCRALAVLLAGSVLTSSEAEAERPFGHYPRPLYFRPSHDVEAVSPSVIASFDAVVTSTEVDSEWLEAVRNENDDIMLLAFITGTTVQDTAGGFFGPDSSTILAQRRTHAVEHDWFMNDVDGNPITTWETPTWTNWLLNVTEFGNETPDGDRYGVWNGRTMARAMMSGVGDFEPSSAWDGIMLDEFYDSITWLESRFGNGQIDADGDGVADDNAALNQQWREETGRMLSELRTRVGDDMVLAMNGETRVLGDMDGASFEECLHHRSWWTDMYGYGDGHGGYLSGIERCRPGPNRFGVFYARYFVGVTPIPFDQFARLAAGSSALGDGYYMLETWDAGEYDAIEVDPTYAFDWGTPLGPMDRFPAGSDTLYGRAFTNAYVEVNPYRHVVAGVPARDIRVTEFIAPGTPAIDPDVHAATVHLPEHADGDGRAVASIDVRYLDEPITEQNFDSAPPVRVGSPLGWGIPALPSGALEGEIEGLAPDSWYFVASRYDYRGGTRSGLSPSLTFRTQPITTGWTPPFGAGAEGDARWQDDWRDAAPTDAVHAIHIGADISVGGEFSHIGGIEVGGFAQYDHKGWTAASDPRDGRLNGVVLDFVAVGEVLVVGGAYDASSWRSAGVARWQGGWMPLGDGLSGEVRRVDIAGGRLVAGGTRVVNNVETSVFSRYQSGEWIDFNDAQRVQVRDVGRFGVWNDDIVTQARLIDHGPGLRAEGGNHVVRWTGEAWVPLGGTVGGDVYAYATAPDGSLIVGGRFRNIGGVAANHVARWVNGAWEPLGTGLNAPVHDLEFSDDLLVAGGEFSKAGDESVPFLARWDGLFWTPVGTGTNGAVFVVATTHDGIIAAGRFTKAGGDPSPRLANWGVVIDEVTAIDDTPADGVPAVTPVSLGLRVTSPNPGDEARLALAVPEASRVKLEVFDVSGRRLRLLVDHTFDAGVHEVVWDGRTSGGLETASGVYYVRMRVGDDVRRVTVNRAR